MGLVEPIDRCLPFRMTTQTDRLRTALNSAQPQPATRLLRDEPETSWRSTFFLRWDRRSIRALIAIVAVLMVVVAWWWLRSPGQPESIEVPVVAASAAPVADVVVHVAGRVTEPGLIRLPAGSRVADAIEAAGGAVKPRDLDSVNLARVLVDGEQIQVGASVDSGDGGININSASAAELEELPGVGPVLASRIVEWRTTNGPFTSIDDLGQVSGIGASVLEQLRGVARV